jgi:hypothetical protein
MALLTKSTNIQQNQSKDILKRHKTGIVAGVIILAGILIIGYLFSGGMIPKQGIGSIFEPMPVYKTGMGAINGHVMDPSGLPALGATVVAIEQGGSEKITMAIIPIDGKYVFENLKPGNYVLMVGFPNGENRVLNYLDVDPGSIHTIDFKY